MAWSQSHDNPQLQAIRRTDCSFDKLASEDSEKFFDQLKYILKHGKFSRAIAVVPVKSGLSKRPHLATLP